MTSATSSTQSALLKGQGSTKFSDRWPQMRPVVLKLLKQEHVTRNEWQDLFWWMLRLLPAHVSAVKYILKLLNRDVHSVCSWDEKATTKIQKGLEDEILCFIKNVETVRDEVIKLPSYFYVRFCFLSTSLVSAFSQRRVSSLESLYRRMDQVLYPVRVSSQTFPGHGDGSYKAAQKEEPGRK